MYYANSVRLNQFKLTSIRDFLRVSIFSFALLSCREDFPGARRERSKTRCLPFRMQRQRAYKCHGARRCHVSHNSHTLAHSGEYLHASSNATY